MKIFNIYGRKKEPEEDNEYNLMPIIKNEKWYESIPMKVLYVILFLILFYFIIYSMVKLNF